MTLGLHTGRSRWQTLTGIFAVLAIVLMVAVTSHPGTRLSAAPLTGTVTAKTLLIPSRAATSASSGLDSTAVAQIPDSTAVVQDPLKASPAAGAAGASGASSGTTSYGGPPPGTGSGTAPAARTAVSGTVTAGDSKANCISLRFSDGALTQSVVNAATAATGVTFNCIEMFANPMPTWADWETPWMFSTLSDNFDSWLAASSAHQVVMGMDLIPQSVSDNSDPLTWEQPCADGNYDQYATALAKNLVSYGAGNIVIRLGLEANGSWEADYAGSTTTEMNDWAKCYASEVTAMRAVPGTHFLFVWNPNICTQNFPLNQWYPGQLLRRHHRRRRLRPGLRNAQVGVAGGLVAYANDSSANTPNDPSFPSLNNIESFAVANGKPMSFPEWGIDAGSRTMPPMWPTWGRCSTGTTSPSRATSTPATTG